ncbi:PTS sugar transporter subunit IIA, partial [Staphylococcus simulans]
VYNRHEVEKFFKLTDTDAIYEYLQANFK